MLSRFADFVRVTDYNLDEPLTLDVVAEATGARVTFIAWLVRLGLLETIGGEGSARTSAGAAPAANAAPQP